jgi:hypothetical protein
MNLQYLTLNLWRMWNRLVSAGVVFIGTIQRQASARAVAQSSEEWAATSPSAGLLIDEPGKSG